MYLSHISLGWYCQKNVYSRGVEKRYKRGREVGNIGQIVYRRGVKPFVHHRDKVAEKDKVLSMSIIIYKRRLM